MTSPSKRALVPRVSPRIVIDVTLLPEPDSPTIPRTWPRSRVKSTPSTAPTMPSSVANRTLRPLTSSSLSAIRAATVATEPRSKPHQAAAAGAQVAGLRLLQHAGDVLSLGRVEDASLAEPESDMGRALVAVRDQVARAQLALEDVGACFLLLVGVSRHEPAEPTVGHVDEAGAVDPALGHAAPLVRRAEVGAGLFHRVASRTRLGEPGPRDCP